MRNALRRLRVIGLLVCVAPLGLACAASGDPVDVGNEPDSGHGGQGGSAGHAGSGGSGAYDGGDGRLRAHIEAPPSEMAIDVITISCAQDCADVLVVASGGNPDYTFLWSDGVTTAAREICATETTALDVEVRDTPMPDGEFPYAGQEVTTSITAQVIECPTDGGAPSGSLCIENPSIEGTASISPANVFDAQPWDPCPNGINIARVVNETSSTSRWVFPPASDGDTYGTVGTNSGFGGLVYMAQTLCEPIAAGTTVSFEVDMARVPYDSTSGVDAMDAQVQVYGGNGNRCGEDELLWTSTLLNADWTTYCVSLTPSSDVTSIAFKPLGDGNPLFLGLMTALVDNIRPVADCAL